MELFTAIEDSSAIISLKKGVHKQVKVYRRGEKVYVPYGGGFIRMATQFGETFPTSHPDVKVLEFEAEGVKIVRGVPTVTAALKVAA
jgi:hypothetical protein